MMRVLSISHDRESKYGANRSLIDLLRGLRGHDVASLVVVPHEGPFCQAVKGAGAECKVLHYPWWMGENYSVRQRVSAGTQTLQAGLQLAALARRWNADVLHTNTSVVGVGAVAAELTGISHVWHLREFGQLDYNLRPIFEWPMTRHIVIRAEARISVSRAVRRFWSPNSLKAELIYNGVATFEEMVQLRKRARAARPSRRRSTAVLAILGKICPSKGQELALRGLAIALSRGTRAHLVVAGSGDDVYVTALKQLALRLGVDESVTFLGYTDDPFEVLLSVDALLMCSPNEAMGRVTVEAMAACCPTIGYASAGTVELIRHGQTGLLFDGSDEQLAGHIALIADHPEFVHLMGDQAWDYAVENFTVEDYSKRVLEVFRRATA